MAGRLGLFAGGLCLLMASTAAHAVEQLKSSQRAWMATDRCARDAFKQFPDYTREGNAKREHAMQQCLAANNLPPRGPAAPAAPPAPAASGQPPK